MELTQKIIEQIIEFVKQVYPYWIVISMLTDIILIFILIVYLIYKLYQAILNFIMSVYRSFTSK